MSCFLKMAPNTEVTFYACARKQSHHEVVTEKSVSAVCVVKRSFTCLGQVRWLDCSTSPPRTDGPRCRRRNYQTRPGMIADMCYVTHGDRELLVTTFGRCEGLFCYNTATDKMEWSVSGIYFFLSEFLSFSEFLFSVSWVVLEIWQNMLEILSFTFFFSKFFVE